eukprot:TRINITY_DN308_c0_g2_i1.p1 TRINITY_DN308_c0_g2~~TRINITY_DN308_c0_g2_i1.p1  ORF type:complete len:437 (+),score=117.79 TRINITY_DN308_c0_g2_i1:534-1844(+)
MSLKKEEDFSELISTEVPKYKQLAVDGKFGEALEGLLMLEKKTRQGGDGSSLSKVLIAIVEICHASKEYKVLNENLVALSKRRGLLKEPIKHMVQSCQTILADLDYDTKMTLMDTLLTITEGKIFVEKARARLVLELAHIRESEGKIDEAAKLLQEVQVETFGTMKKKEKTEYILEQMRLCLLKKDYVRTQIISKKIHPRVLNEEGFGELKISFNKLMIQFFLEGRNHLQIANCYWHIYQTEKDITAKLEYLKLQVLYAVLAAYNNEQSDFTNRLALDTNLEKIASFQKLLKSFLTSEVMNWKELESRYRSSLSSLPVFEDMEEGQRLWADLKLRVIEHNLRVISKYYNRITEKRLAELLDLDIAETEKHLSKLVVNNSVYARINRLSGVVVFKKSQTPSEVLNDWGSNVESLLKIVENTCHLIERENMVHKVESK